LTVDQVHDAVAGLIPSWWRGTRVSARLWETLVEDIQKTQQDNAKSRRSHTKRTRRKLRELGIKLTRIKRCRWNTS
jgi:predicted secreted Zn-dependent protease